MSQGLTRNVSARASVVTRKAEAIAAEYLQPEDAAHYLSRSRSWLDKLKQSGGIPYYRVTARSVLFRRSDLDAFMASFRVDPSQPLAHEIKRSRTKGGTFAKGDVT